MKKLAMVANLIPSSFVNLNLRNRPFFDFTASPSVLTLRSSASGGLEPFSEEKG
ncbi:MAG: hypothetical protein MSR67_03595 [Oscillospiraceae bacterium]|nr:hypothetical protein [Oscillospiraceae bacterium]